MKATVSRKDLTDAIARVIPAVAVKPSTPVLACVHLKAEQSTLTIRATNLSLDITAQISANVEVEGTTAVSGKFFSQIVSKLGGDIVTLDDTGSQLKLKSEAASFDLLTMNAEDFPPTLKIDDIRTFRMNSIALKELIRRTAFACAKDDSRPIYTGVNFVVKGTEIAAVGTNTHRLAVFKTQIFDEASANIIVPAAALRSLQNALDNGTVVTCEFNDRLAAFEFDSLRFITRLLGGNFPQVERLIPTSTATNAEVNVRDLRAAIDRLQVISRENENNQIFLTFTPDGLAVSAKSDSIGEAREYVDARVTGNEIKLALNADYILDALKILDSQIVKIGMNEPLAPALITGTDEVDFFYLVTPLRTQ